jgi:hypothetical protein
LCIEECIWKKNKDNKNIGGVIVKYPSYVAA